MAAGKLQVRLELSADTPDSMDFRDTYAGLNDPWYCFEPTRDGGVNLWANPEGFEHLARYFLKLARSDKVDGFHAHHALDADQEGPTMGGPELTTGLAKRPERTA